MNKSSTIKTATSYKCFFAVRKYKEVLWWLLLLFAFFYCCWCCGRKLFVAIFLKLPPKINDPVDSKNNVSLPSLYHCNKNNKMIKCRRIFLFLFLLLFFLFVSLVFGLLFLCWGQTKPNNQTAKHKDDRKKRRKMKKKQQQQHQQNVWKTHHKFIFVWGNWLHTIWFSIEEGEEEKWEMKGNNFSLHFLYTLSSNVKCKLCVVFLVKPERKLPSLIMQ